VTAKGAASSVALATLLARLPEARVAGETSRGITGIAIDSRAVSPGALFVALRGSRTNGHDYLREALTNGAAAVVVESSPVDLPAGATVVSVADSRRALSALAAAFFGDPSQALDVLGVTGTNGKTTTTHMIASILNAAGIACGIAGTVGADFRAHRWPLQNTTPQPPELHEMLAQMRDDGAKAVAMEISSHALALDRVENVRFAAAVLTNVSRDHLDFHKTLEAYAAAKRRLFTFTAACVLNADDAHGARWALELSREGRRVITYGNAPNATLRPSELVVEPEGSRFTLDGRPYRLSLSGRFNIWNALAAIGTARLMGVDDAASALGLEAVERVPGRMERIVGGGVVVVVDYAHTPDALMSALQSVRETAAGALTVVFGCGGDRDRGKRSEMGAIAARFADRIYVTSDNPRSEDPSEIAAAIVAGTGEREAVIEPNRRRAIERAVAEAHRGDVVLVAGKGHEAYQIVGDRVLPFDDAAVAREALAARILPR
jgi:UDP-N-acetylmuramoyl-L-alanyl-D-glutamate--2,6-diaminopimelate ligase